MSLPKVLTIAGSDSSGGAGIQADLKTFQERDVYGMSALTLIVAMDPSQHWNHQVFPIGLDVIQAQINTIVQGIGVQATKTGMLATVEIIDLVVENVKKFKLQNLVVDPVLVCKGADQPLFPEVAEALRTKLVPLATVVTPNLFEAAQLAQMPPIETVEQMEQAARIIHASGAKYVVVKGGKHDQAGAAIDVVFDGETMHHFQAPRTETSYTHGAGCTFSAAICAELAKGSTPLEAIQTAKKFISAAIEGGFALNQYVGPTDHGALRKQKK
ncbi:MAG: bifunctional hydroxymethylpyrimidine kinase/phosphomethylpyrimidine kinase [Culicoidibacterales bacterium]